MESVSSAAPERATTAVGMTDHIDARPRLGRQRVGDGRDVLELPLDRVRQRVARSAATAAVDGVDREPLGEHRPDHPERGVVGGGAVDEDDRRPRTAREDGDRRAVARLDQPRRRGRHAGARPRPHHPPVASGRARPAGAPRCRTRPRTRPGTNPWLLVEPPGAGVDLEAVQVEAVRAARLGERDEPPAETAADPLGRDVQLLDHRVRQRHQRDDPRRHPAGRRRPTSRASARARSPASGGRRRRDGSAGSRTSPARTPARRRRCRARRRPLPVRMTSRSLSDDVTAASRAAAASSRIQVAPSRSASCAGSAARIDVRPEDAADDRRPCRRRRRRRAHARRPRPRPG